MKKCKGKPFSNNTYIQIKGLKKKLTEKAYLSTMISYMYTSLKRGPFIFKDSAVYPHTQPMLSCFI